MSSGSFLQWATFDDMRVDDSRVLRPNEKWLGRAVRSHLESTLYDVEEFVAD